MPRVEKRRDVIEIHWENALIYGFGGIFFFLMCGMLFHYRGEGTFIPLAWVLLIIGLACFGYGVKRAIMVREVTSQEYTCPYCEKVTELTKVAEADFTCEHCNRIIPIVDGEIIDVFTVNCGFCGHPNYYSDKTEFLICEFCDRQIPITRSDGSVPTVQLPSYYAVQEDNSLYELVLVDHGPRVEELTDCLQHMLSINRNQVKQMLGDLPVTLLTGISRRKAEMLQAQILMHDGEAQARSLT
ncbi:MAG: hypothetical protein JSS72_09500 [Armatimonadetes bacterium]|nr:hypothetical protein [Armatimonadota bacterium]